MKNQSIFESSKFTALMLEEELWGIFKGVKNKTIEVKRAATAIGAAKEIINVSRLRMQHRLLEATMEPTIASTSKLISSPKTTLLR